MTAPLVSIIIPVYKVESYIKDCIESVLTQTYPRVEILCIDDCGADGSTAVIREMQANHPQICLFSHEENKGPGAARNTGMAHASGKYIVFLDGDDCLAPTFIEEMMALAERHSVPWVCCLFQYHDDATGREWSSQSGVQDEYNPMTPELASVVSNSASDKIFRTEFLRTNDLTFDEGVFYEDLGFYAKVCAVSESMCQCNKPLYIYRQRPGSTMARTREGKGPCVDIYESCLRFYQFLLDKNLLEQRRQYLPAIYLPHFRGYACESHYKEEMFRFAKEYFPRVGFPEDYDTRDTYAMNILYSTKYKKTSCMHLKYKTCSALSKLLPTKRLREKWRTWARLNFLEL